MTMEFGITCVGECHTHISPLFMLVLVDVPLILGGLILETTITECMVGVG